MAARFDARGEPVEHPVVREEDGASGGSQLRCGRCPFTPWVLQLAGGQDPDLSSRSSADLSPAATRNPAPEGGQGGWAGYPIP